MTQPLDYPSRPPSAAELPYDDGEPMDTRRHRQQMNLLIDSLEYAWRDRDDFFVGGNMFFYFSETQAKNNDFRGPDVFVVLNTTRRDRLSWVVWEEGGQVPDVVIELLSAKTEHVDRGVKMEVYARLRVGEYFLYDPLSAVFEGYDLDVHRGRYVRKALDAAGRLRCERLGLYLLPVRSTLVEVDATWLRWLDSSGRILQAPFEAALEAEARAAEAEAHAAQAQAQAAQAQAQAAEVQAEAEAHMREAEARAREAEERTKQLEAELAALKRS